MTTILPMITPVDAYEHRIAPYKHQVAALKRSCFLPEFALLLEMGTGKSKVIIDNACILYEAGKIRTVLIIAPNSVYRNWSLREIPTHTPERIQHVIWVHKEHKIDDLRGLLEVPDCLIFIVINVEAFSKKDRRLAKLLAVFMDILPTLMAVDESTTIKAPSNRTKAIIELGKHARYRRIATGLVAPNGPMDIFYQFQFLRDGSLGTRSPISFKHRYCQTVPVSIGMRTVDKVVGVKNIDDLRFNMNKISYRVTKEECLDLPGKTYDFWYSDLDEESAAHYKKMKEEAIFEIENENPEESVFIRSANRVNMVMRLQMITCGHIKDAEGNDRRFSWKRIKDTINFLSLVQGSVIIWSVFTLDIQDLCKAIAEEFGPDSVVHFYGGTTLKERDEATNRIQNKSARYIVANQAAGRFGNTWTTPSTTYYYSNSYDLEYRTQSEERNYRIGQFNPCLYMDAIAQDTINFPMVQSLRKKLDMFSLISGEDYRSWLI